MKAPTMTISEKFAKKNAVGFDYLRIILASSVVFIHSLRISYGDTSADSLSNSYLHGIVYAVLPAFFALSGFLVAGSLQRNNLLAFASLRAMRILPALAVEITLSAFILGITFTTLPISQYLTSPTFFKYFLNILGIIHLTLPGVFEHNPFPGTVNLSLWTIPFEMECYALLAFISLVSRRSRAILLTLTVLLVFLLGAKDIYQHGVAFFYIAGGDHHFSGRSLVISFLFGVNIYNWGDKIPFNNFCGVLCLLIGFLLASFHSLEYFSVAFIAYATVWIGLMEFKRSFIIDNGDYSYGVYLFAAPIQQMLATTKITLNWLPNFLIAIILSVAYAWISWNFVEHPIIKKKKIVTNFMNDISDRLSGLTQRFTRRGRI